MKPIISSRGRFRRFGKSPALWPPAVALALLIWTLPAAAAPGAGDSTLHIEVIQELPVGEEAKEAMRSLVEEAGAAGLPVEPILSKLLEGAAKGVGEARLLAAARTVRARLQRASEILSGGVEAGAAGPVVESEVARVGEALSAGVPPDQARLLVGAAGEAGVPISRAVVAVAALERLRAMGVYEEAAAEALAETLSAGRGESDLRRIAQDYRRHAESGGDASSFFRGRPFEGREGRPGRGLRPDPAGRLEDGRLPDEAGGGKGVVPGLDRLGRDRRDDRQSSDDDDRSYPYDDEDYEDWIPDDPDDLEDDPDDLEDDLEEPDEDDRPDPVDPPSP